MEILKELVEIINEAKKRDMKRTAASTYHRDYLKTKNKAYRKYTPGEYAKRQRDAA